MMHNYDRQTTATAYVPRPEMPYHFPLGAFNPAPMATPASPQYDAPASYGVYNQYGAQPMLDAPFKPQESLVHQGSVQEDVDGLQFVKSENISTLPNSPCPTAVDPNAQAQATPTYQLYTPIDNVMRVINSMREILEPANKAVMAQIEEKQAPKEAQVPRNRRKAKRKRFCCDIPGCSKMFAQKNNLDTHRRSHTGESPFVCPYCQRRFTQSVNLKAHINRHTGERPYECPECDKCFPQLSNLKAHKKTHVRRESRAVWVCRFANCPKAFTAKGNLKAHQNTSHAEEIDAFNAKLAAVKDESMISDDDKEMAKYLSEVHNLANKGIKGRGKGRKVKRVMMLHPPQHQSSLSTSPISTASHASAHIQPDYSGLPYYDLGWLSEHI